MRLSPGRSTSAADVAATALRALCVVVARRPRAREAPRHAAHLRRRHAQALVRRPRVPRARRGQLLAALGLGRFRALRPGDLLLFKLKAPWNAIAGGGVFAHASLAPLSLAWGAFGPKNGNPDLAAMRRTIAKLRRAAPLGEREGPVLGCRVFTSPFFWPEERWLPVPASFATNTVTGKGYSTDEADGLALWQAVRERLALGGEGAASAPVSVLHPQPSKRSTPGLGGPSGPRYGTPATLPRRLGQGAFRLAVTDGYGRRCAVSGERTLLVLDAAHVRP